MEDQISIFYMDIVILQLIGAFYFSLHEISTVLFFRSTWFTLAQIGKGSGMAKKQRPVIEYESYLFSIVDSSLYYGFSGDNMYHHNIYSEYQTVKLTTECVLPSKESGNLFEFVFLGSRDKERELYDQHSVGEKMSPIGSLSVKKGDKAFLGTLPADALWHVAMAISRGAFKFVSLHGEKARYGRAKIISVNFSASYDWDEW